MRGLKPPHNSLLRNRFGSDVERRWIGLDDHKVVSYRNRPDGWVAEVPTILGCYALMPTREEALGELARAFDMIADEHRERGPSLPPGSTTIINSKRSGSAWIT